MKHYEQYSGSNLGRRTTEEIQLCTSREIPKNPLGEILAGAPAVILERVLMEISRPTLSNPKKKPRKNLIRKNLWIDSWEKLMKKYQKNPTNLLKNLQGKSTEELWEKSREVSYKISIIRIKIISTLASTFIRNQRHARDQ